MPFFGPTLILLVIGQVSLLVLFGLVTGIYALKRGFYPLAGALLVIATIKPHGSYLVLAWIGWWVISNRKWSVIIGAGLTITVSTIVTLLLFPDYFQSYIGLLQNMDVSNWYTSTLWSFLEAISQQTVFHWFGILLFPLIFILQPSQDQQDWLPKLGMILATSIALAPYGFSFDQVLLLPVIIQILAWVMQKKLTKGALWIAVGGLISTYAGLFYLMSRDSSPYYWYFWVPFAILFVYAFSYWRIYRGNRNQLAQTT